MSLLIHCDHCGKPLKEPGGLAFGSPLMTSGTAWASKWHLCRGCWRLLLRWLKPDRARSLRPSP